MIAIVNKWNHRLYFLIKDNGSSVILKRDDDTEFEISKYELNVNYRKVSNEK